MENQQKRARAAGFKCRISRRQRRWQDAVARASQKQPSPPSLPQVVARSRRRLLFLGTARQLFQRFAHQIAPLALLGL